MNNNFATVITIIVLKLYFHVNNIGVIVYKTSMGTEIIFTNQILTKSDLLKENKGLGNFTVFPNKKTLTTKLIEVFVFF